MGVVALLQPRLLSIFKSLKEKKKDKHMAHIPFCQRLITLDVCPHKHKHHKTQIFFSSAGSRFTISATWKQLQSGRHKPSSKLKSSNVLLNFILIQYEQKIADPGAVKT